MLCQLVTRQCGCNVVVHILPSIPARIAIKLSSNACGWDCGIGLIPGKNAVSKEATRQCYMTYVDSVRISVTGVAWHPEVITLFQDIDPVRWRALDHNPIAMLSEFTPEQLGSRAVELVLQSRIN